MEIALRKTGGQAQQILAKRDSEIQITQAGVRGQQVAF